VVEGTPLLREHLVKNWIKGSNPFVSANSLAAPGTALPEVPPVVALSRASIDVVVVYPHPPRDIRAG
jgi:hypothetical protein